MRNDGKCIVCGSEVQASLEDLDSKQLMLMFVYGACLECSNKAIQLHKEKEEQDRAVNSESSKGGRYDNIQGYDILLV